MKKEIDILRRAAGMVPLIRSIAREARDRSSEVQRLEAELAALRSAPGESIREIHRLEADLFLQRRGMEQVQKELARIGCSMDPEPPHRIVYSMADKEVAFEERLDETGFRPDHSSAKS